MFMATGRLDAVWQHDGLLEVRDYKTGSVVTERVADDPRARLQAWLAAPIADRLGLQLRIRYEHLAAEIVDDPEPFEPDADDLEAIDEELRVTAAAIQAAAAEHAFPGVAERRGLRLLPVPLDLPGERGARRADVADPAGSRPRRRVTLTRTPA